VINPTQRHLPDNTQHLQETDSHTPGGIRTRNPSKRAALDQSHRPRGHWDRQLLCIVIHIIVNVISTIELLFCEGLHVYEYIGD
jgi:hypothetical protein